MSMIIHIRIGCLEKTLFKRGKRGAEWVQEFEGKEFNTENAAKFGAQSVEAQKEVKELKVQEFNAGGGEFGAERARSEDNDA